MFRRGLLGKAKLALGWVKKNPGKAAVGALACAASIGVGVLVQHDGRSHEDTKKPYVPFERPVRCDGTI